PTRLENDLEARAPDESADRFPELPDVHRTLGVVRDSQTSTDVEILQLELCVPLDLTPQMKQPLYANFVGGELRDLGTDVHVEAAQAHVLQFGGHFRNSERFVEGDTELHSLLAGACVR